MTEADKAYIKAHETWLKAENLNADIIHNEIFHYDMMAKLYTKKSDLMEEAYAQSMKMIEIAEKQFAEWMKQAEDNQEEQPKPITTFKISGKDIVAVTENGSSRKRRG